METIEKVKTCDIHIDFMDNEKFGYYINSVDVKNGTNISLEELRIIARTLSRLAMMMWVSIDEATEITKD